jgi:hypothetical protein
MRRDHSSISLHSTGLGSSVGKHSPPVSASSSSLALSHSAAWGRGDAAAAVAPSPPRSPKASPLAASGSFDKHKSGSLEKYMERAPRSSIHMKGAMSHADLSSLSQQSPSQVFPVRVHVPLLLNDATVEQFIDVELHDRHRSLGSDASAPLSNAFKLSENSLGYGRGDAIAAAAAAAAVAAAATLSTDAASELQTSISRNIPKTISGGSGSVRSIQNHNAINLDLICEPSILPLTCSLWPDPALLERNYKEIPSSRTSFIPAYENNISSLMSELICQRLAGDFQLLADANAKGDKSK